MKFMMTVRNLSTVILVSFKIFLYKEEYDFLLTRELLKSISKITE